MPRPLILVPTARERRVVAPRMAAGIGRGGRLELCGFGIAAAAARTGVLVTVEPPSVVILTGIAGCLDERLAIGEACRFDAVACHGIGAGSGEAFISAAVMGWPHWPGDPDDPATAVGDVVACAPSKVVGTRSERLLLTACAASAGPADVAARRRLHPDASAEDMEGFGVAAACRLGGVPFHIVRGISNAAGDRDHSRWRVDEALEAAADLVVELMVEGS